MNRYLRLVFIASILFCGNLLTACTKANSENRGTEPVVLYMFYLSQEGLPLSVQNPEVSIE